MLKYFVVLFFSINSLAKDFNENDIIATVLILESGGEKNIKCMQGVYEVIYNRSFISKKTKKEICLQKNQFVGFNDEKIEEKIEKAKKHPRFNEAKNLINKRTNFTRGATHFYTTNILKNPPKWAREMTLTAEIGVFRFYRK